MSFRVGRVYDRDVEGRRVLVDRLWPRGLSKEEAKLDEWLRDVAPSTDLRRWYEHDPSRFEEFARRYRAELQKPPAAGEVDHLLELGKTDTVILLTATKNLDISGARVLADHLEALLR
jgi:uncharacterized protein YeaO (DUF488 family)